MHTYLLYTHTWGDIGPPLLRSLTVCLDRYLYDSQRRPRVDRPSGAGRSGAALVQ